MQAPSLPDAWDSGWIRASHTLAMEADRVCILLLVLSGPDACSERHIHPSPRGIHCMD